METVYAITVILIYIDMGLFAWWWVSLYEWRNAEREYFDNLLKGEWV
jgi:hypothetical protein